MVLQRTYNTESYCILLFVFFHGATARSWPGPLHYPGFMITIKHSALCNILLDDRLDRYL